MCSQAQGLIKGENLYMHLKYVFIIVKIFRSLEVLKNTFKEIKGVHAMCVAGSGVRYAII